MLSRSYPPGPYQPRGSCRSARSKHLSRLSIAYESKLSSSPPVRRQEITRGVFHHAQTYLAVSSHWSKS